MIEEQQKPTPISPFFPTSNPNTLLRSLNIPEPLIRPPGVDPCSFLNPNPPGCGGFTLEPLPPLDADPYVLAPRNEIIKLTTDLTVSELAGGTLGETRTLTVVGASDSPANSEVVGQQTMNDAVVTKIQSENTQITLCDVCNVTCNSKNTQKLVVLPATKQQTQPPDANAASDQEPEKNKKDELLQNEPSVDSLFVCSVPDLGSDSFIKREAPVTTGPLSATPVQFSLTGTQKGQGELKVRQLGWCEVCKVGCNRKNFDKHVTGKKHRKTLKSSEQKTAPPPPTTPAAAVAETADKLKSTERKIVEIVDSKGGKHMILCDICKVSYSSRDLSTHVSGKKHMKNLQKSKKLPDLPSPSVEKPNPTIGKLVNPNEDKTMRCELKELQKSLKKSENLSGCSPAAAAGSSVQVPMNEEGNVVILKEGKRMKNGSMESDHEEAAGRKRQKVVKEEGVCGAVVSCNACNVVCTNVADFTSHLASHEHSAKALKPVKAGSE